MSTLLRSPAAPAARQAPPRSRRETAARILHRAGLPAWLERLPKRESLIVLGYHRIAPPGSQGRLGMEDAPCDPGLFSATVDQFDEQIRCLKRQTTIVGLDEAIEAAAGRAPRRGCRLLITFDDGYRDNYDLAFPVLRSHGVPAVFFLTTAFAGTSHVPWWDQLAHLLATARRRRFLLPGVGGVDLDRDGLAWTRRRLLNLVKQGRQVLDLPELLAHLAEAAQSAAPLSTRRRFIDWDEARQMQRGGMIIGSHTHTHPVLSHLSEAQQRDELATSRHLLAVELGAPPLAVAYPTGARDSYTTVTRRLAFETGYRAAFSFYGGINRVGRADPFDLHRVGVDLQSTERFALRVAMASATGYSWP